MTRFLTVTAIAALGLNAAHAHFVFLELPPEAPTAIHMRFAEKPLEPTNAGLQERSAPMAVTTLDGTPVSFVPGDEFRLGQVPEDAPMVGGSLVYGVMDRSSSGRGVFLLTYHAKAARNASEAVRRADLPVEIVATISGTTLEVTVLVDGKPGAGSEVVATLPGAEKPSEATTGDDGIASFTVQPGGWIGIRAMVAEEKAGSHDGKDYALIRHYSTLTFPYPAP